jgi:NADH-quinone oxidoreductase subunit G
MFSQPRKAYVLFGVEPEVDCHNPQLALKALKQASLVVAMSPFKSKSAFEYADVLLPISPFTETSGTYVSAEGRVQSFGGVVRPLGETRPGWKVLRVVGSLMGLPGFDYESSEQVRDAVLQDSGEFADGLDNAIDEAVLVVEELKAGGAMQRIAPVPIYFSDSLVRRAPALQMTKDSVAPTVRMSLDTMTKIGLSDGELVRLTQQEGQANLKTEVDETVPLGCAIVAAGHASTASLGDMFGAISVERA